MNTFSTTYSNDFGFPFFGEKVNHLGNVLNVVTDRKLAMSDNNPNPSLAKVSYFTSDVVSYSDYLPFGQLMPNRHGEVGDYRYGFQGQLHDDELKGDDNSVNFEYRMHDPRIGRFFSIDPLSKQYPHYTPYSFSGNKVIHCRELEGMEEITAIKKGDVYVLIWDISARKRGEGGTILYVTDDETIEQKIRPFNEKELENLYIAKRATVPYSDPSVIIHEKPSDISEGRQSTGLMDEGRIIREAFVPVNSLTPPPPKPPVDDTPKAIVKPKITTAKINDIQKKYSEASVIAFTSSGSSITPYTNKDNGKNIGTANDLGKDLSGFTFTSITINLTVGVKNPHIIVPGTGQAYADKMYNQIVDEMVKGGIDRGKIKKGAVVFSTSSEMDFNVKVK